jgi:hypothetical protein
MKQVSMKKFWRFRSMISIRSILISAATPIFPSVLIEQMAHFFEHYKDLEKGKWVKLARWIGPSEAEALISAAITRDAANSKKRD